MTADRQTIASLCSDLPPQAVQAFLSRIAADYLDRFAPADVAEHLHRLLRLSDTNPAELILRQHADGLIECTILAFDHPFEFSTITGILAGTGFSIETSDVFTLQRLRRPWTEQELRLGRMRARRQRDPLSDAVILDNFRGRLIGPFPGFPSWTEAFTSAITEAIRLLDQGDEESADRAKRLVNERVTLWLTERRAADPAAGDFRPMLQPIEVEFRQLPHGTRLNLRAPDAPAFLYTLSTALSLHGLSIQNMRIRTVGGLAVDQIEFVDSHARPLLDRDDLERVELSVLLTHQFAYFLDRSPNPFTALTRFEKLSEQIIQMPQRGQWMELLSNPHAMAGLARVLGASDFLWEDFIRLHSESLLPIFRPHVQGRSFCPSSQSIPRRLDDELRGARTLAEQQDRLNAFKDRELFYIDLDHILSTDNADACFRLLSERLVFLAENLIARSAQLIFEDLVRQHGRPLDENHRDVGYALFGLGKLGGVALGYASDIELLFVYTAAGKTTGGPRPAITNAQLFETLAQEVARFIRTKREGIFRVDLRLRPYGNDGPLASSRQQFCDYYRPNGPAHPFEKLALVRMRWIGGDPRLGFELEQLRDRYVYEGVKLDLDALWDVWAKMHTQHKSGRQLNSKYGEGGLADLEGAVQLLQTTHSQNAPQLRTPRLNDAMSALRRAGVISAVEFDELVTAYQFLRRLINAQRMLRGSAQDLFLPPPGSEELLHLSRRMNYPPGSDGDAGAQLLLDFDRHTSAVRRFIESQFHRPSP